MMATSHQLNVPGTANLASEYRRCSFDNEANEARLTDFPFFAPELR